MEIKKSKGGHRFSYSVEREGAAQVVVIGTPNVGKSSLISALTGTELEIADYPYTTRIFHPAMMKYEDIQVQLVDLPPLSNEYMENWLSSIIRIADMILIVIDVSRDDLLDQMETTLAILDNFKIKTKAYEGNSSFDPIHWSFLESLLAANKIDLPRAVENYEILKEFYSENFESIAVSAREKINLAPIKNIIIETLEIIRVYSKRPGHEAEFDRPYTFRKGSNLIDFAKAVLKDFAQNLKFARVWGTMVFDGQRINKDYLLQDKDVIELHI